MSTVEAFNGDFSVVDRPVEQIEGPEYGLFLLEVPAVTPWSVDSLCIKMLLSAFFEPGVWRNGLDVFEPDFAPYDTDNDSAWVFWSTQRDAETLVDILSENDFNATLKRRKEWH